MILAISHAPPVTSSATRSSRPRLPANSLSRFGRRVDPASGADLTILGDRDLGEVTVNV